MAKRGTLKAQARKIGHLLTHRCKKPCCESCVRSKVKHRKTHRGAFKRKLKKFGDLVTFDFVDTEKTKRHGIFDETEIFVVSDRYTGFVQAYPSEGQDTQDVVRAIKHFAGRRTIREALW